MLCQAALAVTCHNPALNPTAQRLKERGKPHKLVIVAIARRLAEEGAAVVLMARDRARIESAASRIDGAAAIPCDVFRVRAAVGGPFPETSRGVPS